MPTVFYCHIFLQFPLPRLELGAVGGRLAVLRAKQQGEEALSGPSLDLGWCFDARERIAGNYVALVGDVRFQDSHGAHCI